ncbi:MAG: DUF262 domain-containing protein [Devosia sp.]
MHKFTETTSRSVVWLKRASDDGRLEISPPFQRNPVWSDKQKGSLIETILLEYPIPEIYMQDVVFPDGNEVHVVVDGQQRIRAVLEFMDGDFEIEEGAWSGLSFDDLADEDRKKIFEYKFVTRILPSMPEDQVRAIFQRINRNTVTLNPQELRHATYWGPFIKLMEELADLEFWSLASIFSANDRRRMTDAEFISEIAVAFLNGVQNKKTKLEDFYRIYESEFEETDRVRTVFWKVLGEIEQVLPEIRATRFKKKSDFYTLFLVLAAHYKSLPLNYEQRSGLHDALVLFASNVDGYLADDNRTVDTFVADYGRSVERAASDLGSRRNRAAALTKGLEAWLPRTPLTELGEMISEPTIDVNSEPQLALRERNVD